MANFFGPEVEPHQVHRRPSRLFSKAVKQEAGHRGVAATVDKQFRAQVIREARDYLS
jgi:hypothetical protein